ncbi:MULTISPECIES: fatty acid metabolism transcriptional regulator FadR [Photobacterium]|uniref:Fatty acid metabolism regulator protein n=1 Tax=Photobacterium ganghwense TaxID=320778 RepID=A0A0J1K8N3_9GAMM|nr:MULTISPECIES: fatty acid metabolism transcriptional regulator FadR [Photobacterium]KLV10702.1 GntR family transcriptional regulator [Photobacterium ganghwense]MBV1843474.1 fatty acid metabolism transcriptional regulator FadR [Photobacterium ganghwense]PSU11124.1 fatty acid metabolism transcriptional regulator FadR [Photobacterium ganghwense]QSV13228.1 fatty acid metabolism transcriptional regulator FadR [Photobacterium ganghwense]
MVIKADSPATFAEKYIIESIWNNHFPQGSILPAERELSELIGVTRTTLREVLQRLARDGWLTIQHGKPTRVNNYMDTSGLSILDTLITLDGQDVQGVLEDLLSARTDISSVYMRYAVKGNHEECVKLIGHVIEECEALLKANSFAEFVEGSEDKAELMQEVKKIVDKYGKEDPETCEAISLARAFNYFDYRLFQGMAAKSGNILYALTINGLRKIYTRVGGYYFMSREACELALAFYRDLQSYCEKNQPELVADRIRKYGRESGAIWYSNRLEIARYLVEEEQ